MKLTFYNVFLKTTLTAFTFVSFIELTSGFAAVERRDKECGSRDPGPNFEHRHKQCSEFYENNVNFFLSLFLIIAWGAFVRTVLRILNISVPYTVALMLTGLGFGALTRIESFCPFWSSYTKIARMPPKIILYIFLPALVFESAFNMKVHVFLRSAYQILVVALPGMVISTVFTALICKAFMATYKWSFIVSMLYGSIISATDPVAVVSILRELGTSESLGMMIEGESLLNDGVAILFYEIFAELAKGEVSDIAASVSIKLVKISLGGPALGFAMGKLAVLWLSAIFNDAPTEITITIVAAYLTYWLGEFLGCSGVVSCVVLGLKMSADSTSISPEVEKLVHEFWEMIGYLANTVLFVMVGIIVTETALNKIDSFDWALLGLLYILLNIVRLAMLMILMPWLTRIGYGLDWKDMIVMMWGGLRGAVGLCLSLEVYYSDEFCNISKDNVGPKFLFHTAGIVFFTLAINGTTTKSLLDKLGLTEVSPGRIQDMTNAVKQIVGAQLRTLAMLKHDRFLADASWQLVEQYTVIQDPYQMQKIKARKVATKTTVLTLKIEEEVFEPVRDSKTSQDVATQPAHPPGENTPTPMEFKIMTEEARLRLLKALKVSFWRQYEQGILQDVAVQILLGVAETTADKELHMIHARDFQKYWEVHGFYHWLRVKVIKRLGLDKPADLPPKPTSGCRRPFWWLTTRDWFDGIIHFIVLLNLIPVIWEVVLNYKQSKTGGPSSTWQKVFFGIGCGFVTIYTAEFILKLIGHGCKTYWSTKWNYIDVLVLVFSYVDIGVSIAGGFEANRNGQNFKYIKNAMPFFRLARLSRSLRLFRPLLPRVNGFIDNKVNYSLFLGYDIAKGLVAAVDDVLKFLPQMVEHPKVLNKLKIALEHERLETIRAMGLLQKAHPKIAIGVKTRHASRAVLNQMRETLEELKEDGLVDETETATLTSILEHKMKRLWKTPASIVPCSPESLLTNVVWVLSSSDLTNYVYGHATLLNFSEGDTICFAGDPPNGVYVVVSGMVKLHYIPTVEAVEKQKNLGMLPNTELFTDLSFENEETDFLSTGTVIGELGILTGQPCSSEVTCETSVVAYHISQTAMQDALDNYSDPNDSLQARIWRSIGMKVGAALLPTQPAYQAWTLDKIRMHLEKSAAPLGPLFENMNVPEFITDVILTNGQIMDGQTKHIYTAPCLLPRSCNKLQAVEQGEVKVPIRILVVSEEEIEDEEGSETFLKPFSTRASYKDITSQSTTKIRRKSLTTNFGVRQIK